MKVLVSGSKGMLGQDLCPILEDEGYDVIETDSNSMNILDEDLIEINFKKYRPEIFIHAAGFTDVEKAEKEPDVAQKVNVIGTQNVAKACAKHSCIIVYVSTDYIFDGNKKVPYTENDKPNPINVYGRTKLEGETAVKKYCEKYFIVRTSLLYGIHGKNFVDSILAQKDKKEIRVVNDQVSCPTWTIDLSDGIVNLLDSDKYGVYNICGTGAVSRYDFAKEILKNTDVKVVPILSESLGSIVRRPSYSALKTSIKTNKWQISLKNYLSLRN